jgi:fluoroacetyl-CoA thioesterase
VTLSVGLVGELTASVDPTMLASAVGSGGLDVLSTPSLIALMEHAARNAVEHLLVEDQITVGVRVDVRHLAPTPLGEQVRARAELIEVNGRMLVFHVEVFDPQEKIGEGTHERAIVDPARLLARASAKLPPTKMSGGGTASPDGS